MNRRSYWPEIRLCLWLAAIAFVAALALSPRSIMIADTLSVAGFPLTYSTWHGTTLAEFIDIALVIDVALLIAVAGFWVWRYIATRRQDRAAKASGDLRPPLAEEEAV